MITLRMTGLTTKSLRDVLTASSQMRDQFAPYNHGATKGTEPWMPVVANEGAESFTVVVPACTSEAAATILAALRHAPAPNTGTA